MTNTGGGPKTPAPVDPAKEIIQKLSPALRPGKQDEAARVVAQFVQKLHVGPLPPPEDLAHYEHVYPGAAERIIASMERDQGHRHEMERDHLKLEHDLQSRGQRLAITALIAMLILVGFTFYVGQPIPASILGGATIVAVVGLFLKRDRPEQSEQPPRPPQQQQQQQRQQPKKRRKR